MTARRKFLGRARPLSVTSGVVVVALAVTVALGSSAAPAAAANESESVNFASTTGAVTGAGAGFLYGLTQTGSGPADYLLEPLNPSSFRGGSARVTGDGWIGDGYTNGTNFQTRINDALDQATRVETPPYHATYDLLLSDLFGADQTQPSNTVYPCTSGNCSNWVTFISDVVSDVEASGDSVRYDIWNEPDGGSFFPPGMNTTQYFAMWNAAVNEIRSLQPSATIVGPSLQDFSSSELSTFLTTVKADNTVPNVLNWHFSGAPINDANTAKSLLSSDGISGVQLSMNEYEGPFSGQDAGDTAWSLGQIGRSALSSATHTINTDDANPCCGAGTLDSTLATNSLGALAPTGQWWAYRDYAEITGQLATVNYSSGSSDLIAAEDSVRKRATVLLGDNSGNTGTFTLTLNGLTSMSWLPGNNGVEVDLQRIPDLGGSALPQPVIVSQQIVSASTSSISIPINWAAANDAYFVSLTPANVGSSPFTGETAGATTTIGSNATTTAPEYITYGTNWGSSSGISGTYNGTVEWNNTSGSTAIVHFIGNQLLLYGIHDVDQGQFSVSVDGATPVTVDDYAATRNANALLWSSPGLEPGPHVAVITTLSTKNSASSGYVTALTRADALQATRIDSSATTNTHFVYSSGWGSASGVDDLYDGTANWSTTAGSTATLSFTGTGVALHAVQDVDQGKMTVSVDGGTPVTIDDYASVRDGNATVWTSALLSSGSHTVTVTVTGTHDSSSSNSTIALDSVDIFNSAP